MTLNIRKYQELKYNTDETYTRHLSRPRIWFGVSIPEHTPPYQDRASQPLVTALI